MKTSKHGRIFFKGVIFVLPIALTLALLVWVFQTAEALLSEPLKYVIPNQFHFPGMGILIALAGIYVAGFLIHGKISRVFVIWLQKLLAKVPLVNTIYKNISEMLEFVSGGPEGEMESVVLVEFDNDKHVIGFVTQEETDLLGSRDDKILAVYLPMSYQMGGYLIYVPASKLTQLDMSKKEAMRRVLTADLTKSNQDTDL